MWLPEPSVGGDKIAELEGLLGKLHSSSPMPIAEQGLFLRLALLSAWPAISRTPISQRRASAGFRVLVKTQGAGDRPNGRH